MKREIKFRFWDKDLKKMCFRHPAKMDFSHPNIIPMQFTGLKDKNGVEIYDGDILLVGLSGLITTVEWEKTNARFTSYSIERYIYCFSDGNEREIIGNIHETPELL